MTGVLLLIVLAITGGVIAYLGDKLGSKIGKKRLRLFGLRPHDTSVLMTIVSGVVVATLTMGVLMATSKEVRTALFGMKQIQQEIRNLTESRKKADQELSAQNAKIESLHSQIQEAEQQNKEAQAQMQQAQSDLSALQARYDEANTRLAEAEAAVRQAENSKAALEKDVKSLEDTAKKLRENVVAIREGNVAFRSGEILYAGVLQGGLDKTATQKEMQTFLARANAQVAGRMNIDPKVPVIWLSRAAVEEAAANLSKTKGAQYVRLTAAGNILSGEVVVSRLEMIQDRVVYQDGTTILDQAISVNPDSGESDLALMAFLRDVNRRAQADGVVPNPITGDVGAITSSELSEASEKIRHLGGKVRITAKARGNITVAGPVLLNLTVETLDDRMLTSRRNGYEHR